MRRTHVVKTILFSLLISAIVFPFLCVTVPAFFSRWPIDSAIPLGFTLSGFGRFFERDLDTATGSVLFSVISSALTLIVCIPAVYGLGCMSKKVRRWIEPVFYLPMLMPVVSICIGGHKLLLSFFSTGWGAVLLMHVYFSLPYVFQVIYQAYMLLGRDTETAAKNLGAGPVRVFLKIHLPIYLPDYLLAYTVGFVISYSQYFVNFYFGNADNINFSMVMTPLLAGANRNIASVYTLMYILFGSSVVVICSIIQHIIHKKTGNGASTIYG